MVRRKQDCPASCGRSRSSGAPLGATVNAIAPKIVDTPLTRVYMEKYPERAQAVIANTPAARLATGEDVANVATFLASDRSGFITGQTIVVDGGLSGTCSWW
jgi:NAD(P)-dependent dehydrogenase (short-subunit alcohol dehydrogenase family)